MGTCLSIATHGPSGRERNRSEAAATKHTNKAKKKGSKTAEKSKETKGSNTARNTTPKSSTAAGRDCKQNQIRERLRVASWNVDTKNRDLKKKKKETDMQNHTERKVHVYMTPCIDNDIVMHFYIVQTGFDCVSRASI